jgi:Fe-only nitrogenase accessory protein AnfO
MKIAVIEDGSRRTCSVFEPGWVVTYSDDSGKWAELGRFENVVHQAGGIAGIRTALLNLVKKLGDCKVIAAGEISGVAFSIFEGAGFEIFTAEAVASDILDSVKNEMEETSKQIPNAKSADIQFYLKRGMNSGDYFLDLQELLAENPQVTTKSILLPYLKEGEFARLDVVCGHVPPWFDRQLESLGLQYETVNVLPDRKTVRIVHSVNN